MSVQLHLQALARWVVNSPVSDRQSDRRGKLAEWTRRYMPLEIVATLTALAGGLLVSVFTANPVAIAFGGTWGENSGYYGLAFVRDWLALNERPSADGARPPTPGGRAWLIGKRLVWEFGMAEVLDSFVFRPFCMFAATTLIGSVWIGIIVGKFAADVLFYGVAIVFYELGKRWK